MNIISTLTQKYDASQKEVFGYMSMFGTKSIVGMFSGGHDSLLAVNLVSHDPRFFGVIWADTMTGTGETRRYIRETCERYGWKLERQTVHPLHYESLVLKYGFPTPHMHHTMYVELKAKSISRGLTAVTDGLNIKRTQVGQVTGLRRAESSKRMKIVKPYHEQRDNKTKKLEEVFFNPLWDWSKIERDDMINHLGLVRNAYADEIGHSYECMCYANVAKGEREHRARISPKYEEIELQREIIATAALRIQQLKLETGMIDPDDKVYLSSLSITQGWHLEHEIKAHTEEKDSAFDLCSACVPGTRAADGKGGYDPDVELMAHRLIKSQALIPVQP